MSAVDLVITGPDVQLAVSLDPVVCQREKITASQLVQSRLRLGAEKRVGFSSAGLPESKTDTRTTASTYKKDDSGNFLNHIFGTIAVVVVYSSF